MRPGLEDRWEVEETPAEEGPGTQLEVLLRSENTLPPGVRQVEQQEQQVGIQYRGHQLEESRLEVTRPPRTGKVGPP